MRQVLDVAAGDGISPDDAARLEHLPALVRRDDGEPCLHVYSADVILPTGDAVDRARAIARALRA